MAPSLLTFRLSFGGLNQYKCLKISRSFARNNLEMDGWNYFCFIELFFVRILTLKIKKNWSLKYASYLMIMINYRGYLIFWLKLKILQYYLENPKQAIDSLFQKQLFLKKLAELNFSLANPDLKQALIGWQVTG